MYEELTDRFGKVPKEADFLLRLALLKSYANEEYITAIRNFDNVLKIELSPRAKVDTDKLVEFISTYPEKLRFVKGAIPGFELEVKQSGLAEIDEEKLLETAEQFVKDMRYIIMR